MSIQDVDLVSALLVELRDAGQGWTPMGAKMQGLVARLRLLIRRAYGPDSQYEADLNQAMSRDVAESIATGGAAVSATGRESRVNAATRALLEGLLVGLVEDLTVRGESQALPRRYRWSSPVYWLEALSRMLRAPERWQWTLRHRGLSAGLTAAATIFAAILIILYG